MLGEAGLGGILYLEREEPSSMVTVVILTLLLQAAEGWRQG